MKTIGTVVAAAAFAVSLGACDSKKDGDKKPEPAAKPTEQKVVEAKPALPPPAARPAAAKPDMKALQVTAPKGWEGEYNPALESWTYEKYVPGGPDDTNLPNRLYIDVLPEDAPTAAEGYAAKLKEKDWQDFGFVWTEIGETSALEGGGFVIKGVAKDTTDPEAKPEPAFVVVVELAGAKIRCKSGAIVNDAMRDEGIALCRSVKR